jgi:predicted DNA-binding transcriptional regulator YafY
MTAKKRLPARIHVHALHHLAKICAEIQRGRYPKKRDLARLVERDERTIQRYLERLRDDFDAPLEFDRSRNGFYFTDPAWRLPEITLTEGELISFFAAERILRRLGETAEVRLARGAVRKLAALLPREVVVDVGAIEEAINIAPDPALDASPEVLRQLTRAAAHRRTLRIEYYSLHSGERAERDVDVLLVHNYLGEWYAVCHDHRSGERRDFHAGRISKIWKTGREFTLPEDWNAEEYLKRGFGMFRGGEDVVVEVEFDAYQARYVRERKYHETQKSEELGEGRLRIRFDSSEAALEQVARWLMSFGEHAKAIRPARLLEMMREKLRRTIEVYESTNE